MLKKLFQKTIFWLKAARLYSAPITLLSWLVIFVSALKQGGNILAGIISLFGISLVHLATNLIDDYIDYKDLQKENRFITAGRDCKCAYNERFTQRYFNFSIYCINLRRNIIFLIRSSSLLACNYRSFYCSKLSAFIK